MGSLKKLLLITGESAAVTPALNRAAHLARSSGAGLKVVLYCRDPAVDPLESIDRPLAARAQRALRADTRAAAQRLLRPVRDAGQPVRLELVWDYLSSDTLLERIAAEAPDLVFKDAQQDSMVKRLALGSLDWDLIQNASAPVWLVNAAARGLPTRFIAAVDTWGRGRADLNERLVHTTLALALQADAEAHLAHVRVAASTLLADDTALTAPRTLQALAQAEHALFESLCDRHGVPAHLRHELAGPVPRALRSLANHPEGDVLVLGHARRKSLARLLLGQTAELIAARAASDLLVIPAAALAPPARAARPARPRTAPPPPMM